MSNNAERDTVGNMYGNKEALDFNKESRNAIMHRVFNLN